MKWREAGLESGPAAVPDHLSYDLDAATRRNAAQGGGDTKSISRRPAPTLLRPVLPGRVPRRAEPDHERGHHHGHRAGRRDDRARARHARRAGLTPGEHAADAGYAGADLLLDAGPAASPCSPPSLPRLPRHAQAATRGHVHHRLGPPAGHLPQGASAANGPPAGTGSAWDSPPRPAGPAGPGQVHHLSPPGPADVPAPPRDPRRVTACGPARTPSSGRTVTHAGQRRGHHPAGHRRHRHPHRRYRGLPKTSLEHAVAATAINLIRLDAWHTSKALDRTRTTHLQRLTLAA